MNSGPIRAPVDRFARSFHERATVQFLRGVLVVRTAEQADPVRSVEMRSREPVAMIELKSASLRAPAAALVGERAAASVALEDLAFDRVGNMTRTQLVGLLVRCLPRFFDPWRSAPSSPARSAGRVPFRRSSRGLHRALCAGAGPAPDGACHGTRDSR